MCIVTAHFGYGAQVELAIQSHGGEEMSVASHPAAGIGVVMFSGMLTASFPLPMKFSHQWKWENTWLVYATLALLVMPVVLANWAVGDLVSFYRSIPAQDFYLPLLFGFGWGIAQVTFGLSIARVGMAMSFAIVIGMSAVLGSAIPLAVFHPAALAGSLGAIYAVSAALLTWGLVLYARAGREREASLFSEGISRGAFFTGLALCIFTGLFGAMLNVGFVYGSKIADQAVQHGVSAERATLLIWAVLLGAGYLPNLGYTLYLLARNRTVGVFSKSFPRETMLAFFAAVFWLFGMLGYGAGAAIMGTYGNSIGFAACMIVLLLWSSVLGMLAGEWKVAPLRARRRINTGIGFILASMLTLVCGSFLH